MAEQLIGKVTHYFSQAQAAAVEIAEGELKVGDTIHIKGHTSDFTATIDSMQIDRVPVESAGPGDLIGIRVTERARPHDDVYLVTPD